MGKDAVPALLKASKDKNKEVRASAAEALWLIKPKTESRRAGPGGCPARS